MPISAPNPRSFLPLTPLALQVLLALAAGERHGYAIIRDVHDRTDGLLTLRTGTLYTLLPRLVREGLISESAERPHPSRDDERRRYYALTPLGREVFTAEVRRLEGIVVLARRQHLGRRSSKA